MLGFKRPSFEKIIVKIASKILQQFVDVAMDALIRGDERSSNAIIEATKIEAAKNGYGAEVKDGKVQRVWKRNRVGA